MSIWSAAQPDVLGPGYEAIDLELDDDDEGPISATLVRKEAPGDENRAVLFLHGYNDYFFHTEVADFFTARGRHFYALDLRKCGRSWRPHQTRLLCRSLDDYLQDVDTALRTITEMDGRKDVLLLGHSMGGLVSALWTAKQQEDGPVSALCLNSPFLATGVPPALSACLDPLLAAIAHRRPRAALPVSLSPHYTRSLHRLHGGLWEFDESWKSTSGTRLRLGWLAAMHAGQRQVRAGLGIKIPVLVLTSTRSSGRRASPTERQRSDAVLNVAAITRLSKRLGTDVTVHAVEDAVHDVFLSGDDARRRAFTIVDGWLSDRAPAK